MPQSYQPLVPSRPSSSSSNGSNRSRPSGGGSLKVSHGPKPRLLRRLDTLCCNCITYFPLLIVYGATGWAVWVEAWSISLTSIGGSKGHFLATVGLLLWFMLNWSYTVATFSSPGTPLETKSYSHLPTTDVSSITVKSSGEERFCKKCQCRKPDRTHHCSTCNTCVLKMDHHCPWLANCLGIANYKCFVLFTFYLALFCLFDCAVSSLWLWEVIFKNEQYTEVYMPVNWVLLAVISGVVGIVVTGFSGYHFMLVFKNETTIESLEKTRYLSPLRKRGIPLSAQFVGGNDGVLTPQAIELRERERYNEYIIEETSRAMPNAFDLGWKRNFVMVFGEKRALWFVPVKNSVGDGWTWETSEAWKDAQREVAERRRQEQMAEMERMKRAGWGGDEGGEAVAPNGWNSGNGHAHGGGGHHSHPWTRQSVTGVPSPSETGSSKAARILGAREEEFSHGLGGSRYSPKVNVANREVSVRMQDMKKKRMVMSRADLDDLDDTDDYDTSSDEVDAGESSSSAAARGTSTSESLNRKGVDNWSDGW